MYGSRVTLKEELQTSYNRNGLQFMLIVKAVFTLAVMKCLQMESEIFTSYDHINDQAKLYS